MTIRIRISDLSNPNSFVCGRAQSWFRKHNLDWADFKKNGITLDELHATNDQRGMIDKLEKTARARIAGGAE